MNKNATKISTSRTARGFAYGKFTDKYGQECSIQKSSRMSDGPNDECIWFGVNNNQGKFKVCRRNGTGWETHSLGEHYPDCDVVIPDRMHLTQEMVKKLLPALQHFANTGELPFDKE